MLLLAFSISLQLPYIWALARGIAYIGESANFQRNSITGSVVFEDQGTGEVTVTGTLFGLSPGEHGFHVHQFGDMRETSTLDTLGFHFIVSCIDDPILNISCSSDQQHGFPPSLIRHPGDMGNITADSTGRADISITLGQNKMSLTDSLRSIVGRAVLIHNGTDYGEQPYGKAGGPLAFGVIGKQNIASNEAVGPNVPVVAAAIAAQTGLGSAGVGVSGNVWILQELGSPVKLLTKITGLPAGPHAIRLYQYGHLSNDSLNYGASIEATSLVVTSTGPQEVIQQSFTLAGSNVLLYVGGMCTIFADATSTDFQSVLSMGVIGLGNESYDFPSMTSAALSSLGSLTFISVMSLLAFVFNFFLAHSQ